MRSLYLLALAQLLGGPLVLVHVAWFCKATLHEIPRHGFKQAAIVALEESNHRMTDAVVDSFKPPIKKAPGKSEPLKSKLPNAITWLAPLLLSFPLSQYLSRAIRTSVRLPVWPMAPPTPPPQLG